MRHLSRSFSGILRPVALILCSLAMAHSQATIRYVKPTSSGTGTGASWANASGSLQAMLAASAPGDQIWVAGGTYKPTQNTTGTSTGATDRTNTFLIPSGVMVYGSFAGTETALGQRTAVAMAANPSTLSGDYYGDDVLFGAGATLSISNRGENAAHVISIHAPTAATGVDGFAVTGGYANLSGDYLGITDGNEAGGGLFISGGGTLVSVVACHFSRNSASGYGGAIYLDNGSAATISGCTLSQNLQSLGTLMMRGGSAPLVTNSTFSENWGCGMYALSSTVVLDGCVFYRNYMASAGAGVSVQSSTLTMRNCVIMENQSSGSGAGVYANYASIDINYSTFYGNYASTFNGSGAALAFSGTGVGTLRNSIFWNNATANINDSGAENLAKWTSMGSLSIASCITPDTFPIGNVQDNGNNSNFDPGFVNPAHPAGPDNRWRTADDGLAISNPCSPAIDRGSAAGAPATDMLGNSRFDMPIIGTSSYDLGAYEKLSGTLPSITGVLSGTATICNSSTNLAVAITGGAAPYRVVYSGNTVSDYVSGVGISVRPGATTTYALEAIADANGCPATALSGTPTVTVSGPAAAVISSDAAFVCAGGSTNLRVSITGGSAPYSVIHSGGAETGYTSNTNIPVSPAVTTSYTLYAVTDANGCTANALTGTATVAVGPTSAEISSMGGIAICAGNPLKAKVVIAGGAAPFSVVYSGGTVSGYTSGNGFTVSPVAPTTYTLTSVTDANGCTASSVSGAAVYQTGLARVYVNHAVAGSGTGSSWATAVKTPEEGFAMVCPNTGSEVWIAAGTYLPRQNLTLNSTGTTDRTNTFAIPSGVQVFGGFAGNEATLAARTAAVIAANPTVLSGDFSGNDTYSGTGSSFVASNMEENALHIVTINAPTSATLLNGLTISGGNANQSSNYLGITEGNYNGGGVFITGGGTNFTLASCQVVGCKAGEGGGAFLCNGASSSFTQTTFSRNFQSDGAVYVVGGGSPVLTSCIISDGWGGGLTSFQSYPTLIGCVIADNWKGSAGGAVYNQSGTLTARNCVFSGNSGSGTGAGIANNYATANISHCTFYGNILYNSVTGGIAVSFSNSSGSIVNSIVWGNYPYGSGAGVKEVSQYGGIPVTISNSIVRNAFVSSIIIDGGGNTTANPSLVNASDPNGADDQWFTLDDGLRISTPCSPAVDAAQAAGAPATDITGNARVDVIGKGTSLYDMGAYEHLTTTMPAISGTLSGSAAVCNTSTPLSVAVSGGRSPYTVIYSGDTVTNYVSGGAIPVLPATNTTYTLVSIADADQCPAGTLSGSATVTVGGPTAAVISGNASICYGGSTPLQVNVTGGLPPYSVVYSGGTVSGYTSGSNIPVSPATTTTYTLTSVTDANGCTANTPSGTATVIVGPSAATLTHSGVTAICPAVPLAAKVTVSGGASPFTVTYSGGTVTSYLSGSDFAVSPAVATTYTLTSVTDANGCVAPTLNGTATYTVGLSRAYVNAAASAGGNGNSWATAVQTPETGMARVCHNGTSEVWIAGGIYKPRQNASLTSTGLADRTNSFVIPAGVKVYGSFAGNEATLASRTPAVMAANPTVLSGDFLGDDIVAGTGNGLTITNDGENAMHVVTVQTPTLPTVIDGCTISGGEANGVDDYLGVDGGGELGGGLFVVGGGGNLLVHACTFTGNSAYGGGGAMALCNGSGAIVTNTALKKNSQSDGSVRVMSSAPVFTACTFGDNWGGGLSSYSSLVTLSGCVFSGNWKGGSGGGIYNQSGTVAASNCVFAGNTGSWLGGGIANNYGNCDIYNSTFAGNTSSASGGAGAAIGYANGSGNVVNCILWGNTTPNNPQDAGNEEISKANSGSVVVSNCLVRNPFPLINITDGGNNRTGNPSFVNAADPDGADNLWLTADDGLAIGLVCSPAVDGATPVNAPAADLLGNSRVDIPATGISPYDMGAYEFQGGAFPPIAASFTGSATICNSGTNLAVTITGGAAPYTVVYSGGSVTNYTSGTGISVLPATTTMYSLVSVRDANECPAGTLSGTPTVTVGGPTAAVLSGTAPMCYGASANIRVAITGGLAPYTVVHSGGTLGGYTSNSNIPVSPASHTTYTLISVTDANGCTANAPTGSATITVGPSAAVLSNLGTPALCAGTPLAARVQVTGGASPYSVVYSGGTVSNYTSNTGFAVTPTAPITYTLTSVTDANGCTAPAVSGTAVFQNGLTKAYVSSAVASSGSGATWGTALKTLEEALLLVCPNANSEIWVKGGTYKPTQNVTKNTSGPTDRANTFLIPSGVAVYGSFAGNEATLAARTPAVTAANPTILSGDFNNDDVQAGSGSSLTLTGTGENALHVVTVNNPAAVTLLDGLTICGGWANINSSYYGLANGNQQGGGIFATGGGSNLRINACTFSANGANKGGGALFLQGGNAALITGSTFALNLQSSGAIQVQGSSSPSFTNCVIRENWGGGLESYSSTPTLNGCAFVNNWKGGSGGGIYNQSGTVTARNCVFTGNTGSWVGGGFANNYATANVYACTFYNNTLTASGAVVGAALGFDNSSGTVANSIFWNNVTTTPNDAGNEEVGASNSGSVTISNSLSRDALPLPGIIDGGGNLTANPHFVNPAVPDGPDGRWFTADDGLQVGVCSPAVDAGLASGVPATDILGNGRVDIAATVGTGTFDMGAYEVQSGVLPSLSAAISGSATTCNSSVNLTVAISGGVSPYLVVYSGGTVSNYLSGTGISVMPVATTTYGLISVKDANGCPAGTLSGTATITINGPTTAVLSGNATICYSGTAQLQVAVTGGLAPYQVIYSGGTVSGYTSGGNIPVSPATTTTYTLTSVTDANGCVATMPSGTATIAVGPSAAALSATGSTIVCPGGNSTARVVVSGGVAPYQVVHSGGIVSNYTSGNSFSVSPAGAATYTLISVTDANGCAATTLSGTADYEPGQLQAYVNGAVASSGDGTSWATAFKTLEEGLSRVCLNNTSEVWLATGIYKPTQNLTKTSTGATDRTNTFQIPSGVKVYGGFAGNEATRTARTPAVVAANPTILSGDFSGNDVISGAGSGLTISNNSENALHVITINTPTSLTLLDGLTITGGRADINTPYVGIAGGNQNGGGLLVAGGGNNVQVNNCTFYGCWANDAGGALVLLSGSSAVVTNCRFHSVRQSSSAIAALGSTSTPVFTDCTISNNWGGGMYIYQATVNLNGCVFQNNWRGGSGGGIYCQSGTVTARNSIFSGNTGNWQGGGIAANYATANVYNCTFYGNTLSATGAASGAAINYDNSSGVVINTIAWNNATPNNPADAGQEEITKTNAGAVTINNCLIRDPFPLTNITNGGNNLAGSAYLVNPADPDGADNLWRTADDGLIPHFCSPAVDAGIVSGALATDIMGTTWANSPAAGAGTVDIGAYEVTGGSYPTLSATISGSTAICNSSATLTVTVTGGLAPYSVTYTGGVVSNFVNGMGITVLPGITTTYSLTSVTDANNCPAGTLSGAATVSVEGPSAAVLGGNASICYGGSANIQVAITGGLSPYQVVYSGGALSNYVSGSNIPVTPLATTTYTLTSIVDANGCTANTPSGAATITVGPSAAALTTLVSPTLCPSKTYTATVTVTGGTSPFLVVHSEGTVNSYTSGSSITLTPAGPSIYNLVSVTDANGCAAPTLTGLISYQNPLSRAYVNAAITSSGDGASWTTAVKTLGEGLEKFCNNSGGEIWVAGGTYKPTQNSAFTSTGPTDRSNTFVVPAGASMYGGFAGTETQLSDRTPAVMAANPSVLSGDFSGNDGVSGSGSSLTISNNGEDARNVVTVISPTVATLIDGFTITGGNADAGTGGGIYTSGGGGNLQVSNCTITGCASSTNGGALAVAGGSAATFTHVTFAKNRQQTGAVSVRGSSSPVFSNCLIRDSWGGGMDILSSTATLNRCAFQNNWKGGAGGGIYCQSGTVIANNSIFTGNTGSGSGGGIAASYATANVYNCTFNGNTLSASGAAGAAIGYDNSSGTVVNTIAWNNITTNNPADAGQEEITKSNSGSVSVSNSLIRDPFPLTNITNGGGNLSGDPAFANAADPDGADNRWFTADDGLVPGPCTPGIDAGTATSTPATDVLGNARVDIPGLGTLVSDIGAYEQQAAVSVFNATLSGSTAICVGISVPLSVTLSGGTSPFNLMYSGGTIGAYVAGAPITVTPTASTAYTLTSITDANGCTANVLGSATVTVKPARVLVDGTKAPGNDGLSWATAVKSIDEAKAIGCSPLEIWIKGGTYLPTQNLAGNSTGATDRTNTFVITGGLSVYGGFAGTENTLAERTPAVMAANPTIFSGDLSNNDGLSGTGNTLTLTNNSENTYHVVTINAPSQPVRLNGLVIRGGNANVFSSYIGYPSGNLCGGGMFVEGSSAAAITLENCLFTANASSSTGGGAYVQNGTQAVNVDRCVFFRNTGTFGGGFSNRSNPGVRITNSVFAGNRATTGGGGFHTVYASSVLTNCTFSGNVASNSTGKGGACYFGWSAGSTLRNVIAANNPTPNNASDAGNEELFKEVSGGTPTVYNSLVTDPFPFTAAGVANGGGNMAGNPLFVDASDPDGPDNLWFTADDGLRLACGSPAINGGANTGVTPVDLLERPRTAFTTTDLGAYESRMTAIAAPAMVTGANVATTADAECPDQGGWTHYYNSSTGTQLLSLKKGSNDIGTLGDGTFAVSSNTNANWGSGSGTAIAAPYVTNTNGWFVMNRWWNVTPTAQPTTDVPVRTYFTAQDLADVNGSIGGGLTNPQLRFYKINGGNAAVAGSTPHAGIGVAAGYNQPGYWEYANGVSATTTQWALGTVTDGFYGEYVVRSFSGGGGGGSVGGGGAFPVEWLAFTAVPEENGTVALQWQTASEQNSARFVVERSADGAAYEEITTVAAAGTSTVPLTYGAVDGVPLRGRGLYRIREVDMDGNSQFSNTVEVFMGEGEMQVYPNPATHLLYIKLPMAAAYTLSDATGRVVRDGKWLAGPQTLSLEGLAAGIYTLQTGNQAIRVVKE